MPSTSRGVINCAKQDLSHPFSRIKSFNQWAVDQEPILTSTTSAKIGKTAIWCQICTIPTFGAAYGGNPRSEKVKQLECDQILCVIASHDARNPALRAHPTTSVANDLRTVSERNVCAYESPKAFRQRYAKALQTRSARIESTCFLLSAHRSVWETEKVTLLGCRPANWSLRAAFP